MINKYNKIQGIFYILIINNVKIFIEQVVLFQCWALHRWLFGVQVLFVVVE